ncbi:MAG: hypothetical protein IJS50_06210 [Desulfovibrio sp.]|nr:hypothetical protein [Desulfovibrio sp.]
MLKELILRELPSAEFAGKFPAAYQEISAQIQKSDEIFFGSMKEQSFLNESTDRILRILGQKKLFNRFGGFRGSLRFPVGGLKNFSGSSLLTWLVRSKWSKAGDVLEISSFNWLLAQGLSEERVELSVGIWDAEDNDFIRAVSYPAFNLYLHPNGLKVLQTQEFDPLIHDIFRMALFPLALLFGCCLLNECCHGRPLIYVPSMKCRVFQDNIGRDSFIPMAKVKDLLADHSKALFVSRPRGEQ